MSYATDPTYNPKGNPVTIVDGADIQSIKHTGNINQTYYQISYYALKQPRTVNADKIFIATGVETPSFIKKVLNPNDQLSEEA